MLCKFLTCVLLAAFGCLSAERSNADPLVIVDFAAPMSVDEGYDTPNTWDQYGLDAGTTIPVFGSFVASGAAPYMTVIVGSNVFTSTTYQETIFPFDGFLNYWTLVGQFSNGLDMSFGLTAGTDVTDQYPFPDFFNSAYWARIAFVISPDELGPIADIPLDPGLPMLVDETSGSDSNAYLKAFTVSEPVPEPGALGLFCVGILGLLVRTRVRERNG